MADESILVRLGLDTTRYVSGASRAANETDKLAEKLDRAADDANDYTREADKASKATDSVGRNARKAADSADKFGREAKDAAGDTMVLDRAADDASRSIFQLAREQKSGARAAEQTAVAESKAAKGTRSFGEAAQRATSRTSRLRSAKQKLARAGTSVGSSLRKAGNQARRYARNINQATTRTRRLQRAQLKASKSTSGFSAKMALAGKALLALFAAQQAVNFAKSTIKAYTNLGESINAVNVQFGAGATQIKAFGTQAATAVGLANSEFNQLSVTTGALLSNFIDDERSVAAETIRLTERAADMASVFNTSVPDALAATQAAIRGENEPIRKYGVLLDDVSIRARAVELGLAATTAEVNTQTKGLAALDLIYEQTNKTQGDFAATSEDAANKSRIFAARLEDTKAKVGEALVPALDALLDVGNDLLPLLESLGPIMGLIAEAVGVLAVALDPLITGLNAYVGLVSRGVLATKELFGDEDAARANRYREAVVTIESATAKGQDKAVAYANAIAHLARNFGVTTEQIAQLAEGIEFNGEQQADAIAQNLEFARSHGVAQESIGALEEALLDQILSMDTTAERKLSLIEAYQLEAAAAAETTDPVIALTTEYEMQSGALTDLSTTQKAARSAGELWLVKQREAGFAAERAARKTLFFADTIRAAASAQAEAASPVLALLRAQERVRDAQARLIELEKDQKTSSEELQAAQVDVIEAQLGLETSAANAADKLGSAEEAMLTAGAQAGLSEEDVRDLIASLDDLPTSVVIDVNTRFNETGRKPSTDVPTGTADLVSRAVDRFGGIQAFQFGGSFAAGQTIDVGEAGPERLVPTGSGNVAPTQGDRTVQIFMESAGDAFDDTSLALAMAGITEEMEWAGPSTLRG